MTAICAGKLYRLAGHAYKASKVTRTHAQLDPLTRGAELHLVAFGELYRLDAIGQTHRTGFRLADLEVIEPPELQSVFPWSKGKR